MGKCDICGKEKFNEFGIMKVTINGEKKDCCPSCFSKLDGKITSVGYSRKLKNDDAKANKKIQLYYQVEPEYFGNASCAKLEFKYEKDIPLSSWQNIGKLTLLAAALGMPDDIDAAFEELKKGNEEANKIFDTIIILTEEEYNAM